MEDLEDLARNARFFPIVLRMTRIKSHPRNPRNPWSKIGSARICGSYRKRGLGLRLANTLTASEESSRLARAMIRDILAVHSSRLATFPVKAALLLRTL